MLDMFFHGHRRHPLRELRERANVTQMDLAKLTGIGASRISMAENLIVELSPSEEKKIKASIASLVKQRQRSDRTLLTEVKW